MPDSRGRDPWIDRVRRLWRRVRLLARSGRIESAMAREIEHHLDEEIADRLARGMTPSEARRTARIDFGGVERIKEDARDARGGRGTADFIRDVRYAARVCRRNPATTAIAVVTCTLGIGAAASVFSLVYGVLLRPLPYANPQQLAVLWERNVPRNKDQNVVSAGNFEAWRSRAHSFSGMAALMPAALTMTSGGDPERVPGAEVTPGYFSLLGVPPAIGRDFTEDDARGRTAVILSHGYWLRRFGGDRAIVGRAIAVGEHVMTVTGVMPASFDPPRFGWLGEQQLWTPMALTEANRSWGRYLLVVARLKDGVALETARAEMRLLAAQRAAESPANAEWSASVVSLAAQSSGDVRASLLALLAGVALLFVMAMTNLGTLALSAMHGRQRELTVRRAIGATDARLFRQLFTQYALVGLAGTATGILLAFPATRLIKVMLPPEMPRVDAVTIDGPVILVVAVIALLSTIVVAAMAARRGCSVSRRALIGGAGGRTTARAGGALVISAEIALGLAVSLMALLMVRSVVSLNRVDLGFDPDSVVAVRLAIPAAKYDSPERQREFYSRLLERVRAISGVESAAVISARPLGGIGPATTASDAQAAPAATPPVVDVRFVDGETFRVLKMRVVSGTTFDAHGDVDGPPHVVISESLARALWPGEHSGGRHVRLAIFNDITPEVIGVVGDMHLVDARTPIRPTVYLSAARFADTDRDLLVRATGTAADALVPQIRAAVGAIEPGLPISRVTSMPQLVDRSIAGDRFTMFMLAAFATAALMLAGIGVFGVFSGDVAGRRKEIGLRLALGGSAAGVIGLLLRHAMRRAGAGIAAGLALALLTARSMSALLFGVSGSDPLSILTVTAGAVLLTSVATLIPTVQALRASPLVALRDE